MHRDSHQLICTVEADVIYVIVCKQKMYSVSLARLPRAWIVSILTAELWKPMLHVCLESKTQFVEYDVKLYEQIIFDVVSVKENLTLLR